jgi:hypothetical protein
MTSGGSDMMRRFEMGALMGGSVGAIIGALLATVSVLRHGHGGAGFLRTVGRTAFQSGASFGLFMGIGSVLRADNGDLSDEKAAFSHGLGSRSDVRQSLLRYSRSQL